jgi:hypothetical protein
MPKRTSSVAAAEVTKVEFSESSYSSSYSSNATGYFGNVNPQNNKSSAKTVSFSSDGTATKRTAGERTVNGTKTTEESAVYSAQISPDDFALLAGALAENDFNNLEDSRASTSLPIKKVLTITYTSGVKVINTDNMNRDTPELSEILTVFRDLEKKTAWTRL